MGTMVHKTLEQCYHLVEADRPPTKEELAGMYKNHWTENLPDNLLIVHENMSADDYFAIGNKALRWFHETYYPFDEDITLGLERHVSFALDDEGRCRMRGIIDRLAQDKDGRLIIQDYKTNKKLPTQSDVDLDGQLALYQLAVEDMWPDNNGIVLRRYFLRFCKPLESQRTPEQLAELRHEYIRRIKQIENAIQFNNFPANESALCSWCDYNEICPAKGGTGRVETPQEELPLVTGEPLRELVDSYIALDAQKKEIGKQLESMKKQLIRAAENENTKRLDGKTAGSVMVTTRNIEKLPTKTANPEVIEIIEEIIRKEGLYDAYSQLDMRSLQKAFDAMELPESIRDTLEQWTELTSTSVVRVSANKKGA